MSVPTIYDADRKGTVLRIERSSVHDGPGLRTVLFLKWDARCGASGVHAGKPKI